MATPTMEEIPKTRQSVALETMRQRRLTLSLKARASGGFKGALGARLSLVEKRRAKRKTRLCLEDVD